MGKYSAYPFSVLGGCMAGSIKKMDRNDRHGVFKTCCFNFVRNISCTKDKKVLI